MNCKRLMALALALALVFALCACGETATVETTAGTESAETTLPLETTETTGETETAETTGLPIYTYEETTVGMVDVSEIQNALRIEATPATETREIPLLVILANFDADGDGENDWDESDPTKLHSDKTKKYYGEQWASTNPEDHYELYFGDGYSLSNYYNELSMGAFRFVPIEFDVVPEGAVCQNGVLEVTVPIRHPTASGDAQGAISAVVKACDPYIDFSKLDLNDNGNIDTTELGVLILNPGADASSSSGKTGCNSGSDRNYFEVWGTSQGLNAYCDGMTFTKVSNVGEYKTVGVINTIGVPTHELAHNLGAEDLYDRNVNATGGTVTGWPRAYYFSLQCNGNSCGGGAMPSYLDPYQRIYLGWAEEHVVEDGVYTISSTCTGKYVVLRVNTPDPDEYYLIEIRLKEGFEKSLTSGNSQGGIMIWHIDETINRSYFTAGMASSSYASASTGLRHDPGIVPLFRGAFDQAGQLMSVTKPSDPFYYLSDDPTTAVFDSGAFRSVTSGTQSLNSYPADWEGAENYNLHVEVLSAPGQEMTIKITSGRKDFVPVLSATYSEKTASSLTIQGKIEAKTTAEITTCGLVLSTSKDMTENVLSATVALDENDTFSYRFDGLTADTRYYYKVYVLTDVGYAEASGDTPTSSAPQAKSSAKVSFYRGLTTPDKAYTMTVKYGAKIVIKFPMTKEGYTFAGWYTDPTFTTPFDLDTVIAAGTEDFSLYAKWEQN